MFKCILFLVAGIILLLIIAGVSLIAFLTLKEYRPEEIITLEASQYPVEQLHTGETVRILTWNTGYCGLDQSQDFFMDGGSGVQPSPPQVVTDNLIGIQESLQTINSDLILLQEVDTDSKRSYHQNQQEQYETALSDYASTFAYNFKVAYIPYPLPPIGEVNSGIMTLSRYQMEDCERVALPTSFSWPVRIAQLKRCLLVSRLPLKDSGRELVLVNLHLEAYDDGSGKIAQTTALIELLEQEYEKGNYVIAGGDFNQVFSSVDSQRYMIKNSDLWTPGTIDLNDFSAGWQFAVDDKIPTCRLLNEPYDPDSINTQHYVIDGFILSPNVTLEQVETIDLGFRNSDHNPVCLQVTFPES